MDRSYSQKFNKEIQVLNDAFKLWASLVAQTVKNSCNVGELGLIPGFGKSPLEKGMTTHSSIFA